MIQPLRTLLFIGLLAGFPALSPGQSEASQAEVKTSLGEYEAYAKNQNAHVRKAAVEGLYGTNHHHIAQVLLKCLKDKDQMVRDAAIRGLGLQNTKRTIIDLTQILWRGRDQSQRLAILEAFRKSRPASAYSAIQDLCEDKNWEIKASAIGLLSLYPDEGGKGLGTILPSLEHREALVRLATIKAVATLGNRQANKAVIARLKDKDWRVRAAAIQAIQVFRMKSGIEALITVMEEEDGRLVDDADAGLQALTGVDFSADAKRWRKWWTLVEPRYRVPTIAELRAKTKKERVSRKGYAISINDRYPPYHGIKTRSRRMIFVVDTSASMSEKITLDTKDLRAYQNHVDRYGEDLHKVEIAKRELIEVISKLRPYVRFNIILFDSSVKPWKKGLVPANGSNKNRAIKFLSRLSPASLVRVGARVGRGGLTVGQTNTFEALNACFSITKKDDSAKKGYKTDADTVFFLSDGNPTVGRIVEPQMLLDYFLTVNQRAQLVIHTISFGNGNQGLMRPLAHESGGQYVCVGN